MCFLDTLRFSVWVIQMHRATRVPPERLRARYGHGRVSSPELHLKAVCHWMDRPPTVVILPSFYLTNAF
jgi:hypothetical protein